jgi:predicted O-methyltransferase YrrM
MIEVCYGNVTQEEADRLERAAGAVDDVAHIPGSAEPWVSRLVHSFIIATGARAVLETGCFMGGTSAWILDALNRLGGGVLFLSEIEKDRLHSTVARIAPLMGEHIGVVPHHGDVLDFLGNCKTRFDLVWLDDNHEKPHVFKELQLLLPKMNEGGIILGHDVWGSCDLQEVFRKFGGYSLELPRLGAAGGIGIIQVPHLTSRAVF